SQWRWRRPSAHSLSLSPSSHRVCSRNAVWDRSALRSCSSRVATPAECEAKLPSPHLPARAQSMPPAVNSAAIASTAAATGNSTGRSTSSRSSASATINRRAATTNGSSTPARPRERRAAASNALSRATSTVAYASCRRSLDNIEASGWASSLAAECARQESNLPPRAPEARPLSPELRAPGRSSLAHVHLNARTVTLPLAERFTISRSSQNDVELAQVEVIHDGVSGFGEAAPIDRYDQTAASARAWL